MNPYQNTVYMYVWLVWFSTEGHCIPDSYVVSTEEQYAPDSYVVSTYVQCIPGSCSQYWSTMYTWLM